MVDCKHLSTKLTGGSGKLCDDCHNVIPTKMTTINLNSPFRTAGKTYKWAGDPTGFGIKAILLADEEELKVVVDNREYTVSKKEARDAVKKYNSFYYVGTTKLAIIPKQIFSYEGLQSSTQLVVSETQGEITPEVQRTLFQ